MRELDRLLRLASSIVSTCTFEIVSCFPGTLRAAFRKFMITKYMMHVANVQELDGANRSHK